MRTATTLLFALVLLALGALGGHHYATSRSNTSVQTAKSNFAACESALASKDTAIQTIDRQLAELRERHRKALGDAQVVLDQRDADIDDLREQVGNLTNDIRKSAHADASCAALARLPVCAAVARKLWPARDASPRRDAH